MKEADRRAAGFVPGLDGFGRRKEFDLAVVALEIVRRLVRKRDAVILAGTDDEPLHSLSVKLELSPLETGLAARRSLLSWN